MWKIEIFCCVRFQADTSSIGFVHFQQNVVQKFVKTNNKSSPMLRRPIDSSRFLKLYVSYDDVESKMRSNSRYR